ncbi:MAG: TatD family hydrolase [Gammaproteobacteria bacterium]|nr:TatD family hydrolase [Gammaproteobacteria bacterium]
MLVDSHCHLDRLVENASGTVEDVLQRARNRGVERFLCIATSLDTFKDVNDLAKLYQDVYCTAGVHPLQKDSFSVDFQRLVEQANQPKVVAVGETGLDYYYSPENADWQKQSLRLHIQAAREVSKPLIIHTRDAKEDTLAILKEEKAEQIGGVLHCFTESLEMAEAAIEMGFYISFSGIITFKTATALRDVVARLPIERLLVETDCPWLAPVPYRGKENQPSFVVEVAQQMADIFELSLNELAKITTQNFYSLFPTCQT